MVVLQKLAAASGTFAPDCGSVPRASVAAVPAALGIGDRKLVPSAVDGVALATSALAPVHSRIAVLGGRFVEIACAPVLHAEAM